MRSGACAAVAPVGVRPLLRQLLVVPVPRDDWLLLELRHAAAALLPPLALRPVDSAGLEQLLHVVPARPKHVALARPAPLPARAGVRLREDPEMALGRIDGDVLSQAAFRQPH